MLQGYMFASLSHAVVFTCYRSHRTRPRNNAPGAASRGQSVTSVQSARQSDWTHDALTLDTHDVTAFWLRRNGVNTEGAAAKVISFDRLGKRIRPGTFGKIKVG